MTSNFDKYPAIKVDNAYCIAGWEDICNQINDRVLSIAKDNIVVVVDCYHGVLHQEVEGALQQCLIHNHFIKSTAAYKSNKEIEQMVYPDVTDDSIFGYITSLNIDDYFDNDKLSVLRTQLKAFDGIAIVYGEGAAHAAQQWDLLIYLDMARWEIQLRMRNHQVANLGMSNFGSPFNLQYKQAYFVDWRVLDRYKVSLMDSWDLVIDNNKADYPKMTTGIVISQALSAVVRTPFRVVPFFDPGPWGGQWLKEVADLDRNIINYAWGFDCVPEENSLLLDLSGEIFEIPSINIVFKQGQALLGKKVYERFGPEFPIRFDFLDTMDGGNLSLQVHPTKEYIKEHFGMQYTQDESYYMLDAKNDPFVYLGLVEDADPESMIIELKHAQAEGADFNVDKYVCKWPVKKHDHYLIPAGTIHCSGKDSVVLEISATPYIFTFKLWDWGRLGLDGKPRPINIDRGAQVINWERDEKWTKDNLVNQFKQIASGDGWVEESTGLHKSQFIETRRHWFTKKVLHNTNGGVNVINLVEGKEAVVESPEGKFEPFTVHYAETFIVPAQIGNYTLTPVGLLPGQQCATLKAYVRS